MHAPPSCWMPREPTDRGALLTRQLLAFSTGQT